YSSFSPCSYTTLFRSKRLLPVVSAPLLGFRPHVREKNYIPNARAVGEQHHQAINPEARPGGGRQAVFQRPDVVGVVVHGLRVTRSEEHTSELQSLRHL